MTTFTGTANADLLPPLLLGPVQALGNDSISGLGGDDLIAGYTGDDTLNGGQGADVLIGGVLNVLLNVGTISVSGNDTASYEDSAQGVQVDLSSTAALNVNVLGIQLALTDASTGAGGDAQGDILVGINNLTGSASADILTGNINDNLLIGNAGNDMLLGGDGADTITGDAGIDRLYGDAGDDNLAGGAGKDILTGGAGADVLNGGADEDTAAYSLSDAAVTVNLLTGVATGGHAQGDTLISIESLIGSNFDDTLTGNALRNTLTGGAGADTLNGGAGDDNLEGGLGADHLIGGSGFDFAYYNRATSGVTANLGTGGTGGEAAGDTYSGIEGITGSRFNDFLTGDAGNNYLRGDAGDDTLDGGSGIDQLAGGAGSDTFVFAPDMKADRIIDFDSSDRIDVRAFGFSTVDEALAHAIQGVDYTRLDFGDGDRLVIEGYTGSLASLGDHIIIA